MAMGTKRGRERQEALFYASEQTETPGHPFYEERNRVLAAAQIDEYCERECSKFYHSRLGRPSLAPGVYFRALLIGFFEGIGSERGIAWRVADSLSLRRFLKYGLDEATPDHVTISRTWRLLDEPAHQAVFTFVLSEVAKRGLLKGKTIGIDATSLEANAAMKSIVRRDTGESYLEYLRRLAKEAGVESYIPIPQQKRKWEGKADEKKLFDANRRRVEGERGKRLLRRRGEFLERPFAHQYETGGMRRLYVRGLENVAKRVLLQAAACNLALILRSSRNAGTPRGWAEGKIAVLCALFALLSACEGPQAASQPPAAKRVPSPVRRSPRSASCAHRSIGQKMPI